MNEELVNKFESMLMSTNRPGMDKLIEFIRSTDFYEAPASTRFHSCHRGGLLEHTMNLYTALVNKARNPIWNTALADVSSANLIICALLHDLCKANMYAVELKNKKIYSETGNKSDANGRYSWETVEGYTVDNKIPLGHGEKSVIMAMEYIKLEAVEKYAIRWHMGFTEPQQNWNDFTAAIKKYPLVLAIHQADLEATYLMEEEE